MGKIFILLLVLSLITGVLFADANSDILNLKKEMKKQQTGMLIAMTIIVVTIASPITYEGLRTLKNK